MNQSLRQDALTIVEESIRSVLPDNAVKQKLKELNLSRVVLVAIGKAAWRMAKAAKEVLKERIKKASSSPSTNTAKVRSKVWKSTRLVTQSQTKTRSEPPNELSRS